MLMHHRYSAFARSQGRGESLCLPINQNLAARIRRNDTCQEFDAGAFAGAILTEKRQNLSGAEVARRMGITQQAASKLIANGILTVGNILAAASAEREAKS